MGTVASNSCFVEHSAALQQPAGAGGSKHELKIKILGLRESDYLTVATCNMVAAFIVTQAYIIMDGEGENYPENQWCDHVPPPPILPIIFCNNLWPQQRLETLSVCRHRTHGGKPGHHLDVS